MSPRFRHRTTKKESRRWPRLTAAALEERIDEIMDRLLEYSPDYAAERASGVVSDCAKLGIELPAVELLDLMPEWTALLR